MPKRPTLSSPASATEGFFQTEPHVDNQFHDDIGLLRVFKLYLPTHVQSTIAPDLSRLGEDVLSKKFLDWTADAERNPPYLKTWDAWGRRKDELVTSEGWRALQAIGISEGIVAIAYEADYNAFSRVYQFLKYHIWSGTCANVTCPSAMTDGAASLLSKHMFSKDVPAEDRQVFSSALKRLKSRDVSEAWTSGQWMTERRGGSDVSDTETVAVHIDGPSTTFSTDGSPLGPYSITGFKWFSSATDANVTILLARETDNSISAFFAPTRRNAPSGSELNGISIQRLKSKLGTRPLPTAELELNGMRAYRLGQAGNGIREISTMLNITRIHTAATAMGYWSRGLSISRAFARVRIVGGKPLSSTSAHVHTLATQHIQYLGYMHLTFFTVLLLGLAEHPSKASLSTKLLPTTTAIPHLLRVLTPIAKSLTAKASIAGLAECMESLGGVGYLENDDMRFNIARLFRDANVLSIWEGTTDVLADDVVRVLKGRGGVRVLESIETWIFEVVGTGAPETVHGKMKKELISVWEEWKDSVETKFAEELKMRGRDLVKRLGALFVCVLLLIDAGTDGDEVAFEAARRWAASMGLEVDKYALEKEARLDSMIVFGQAGDSTRQEPKL